MAGLRRFVLIVLAVAFSAMLSRVDCSAQFRTEAFQQQYNEGSKASSDSVEVLFSFKDFFGGLGHKNEMDVGTMTAGSAILIGAGQIYNRDYWKLPLIYGTIAGGVGAGLYYNSKGSSLAPYCFAGAGLAYWASLMDGVVNYEPDDFPNAGKAAIYSILLPGLGQIYNKEYWKLPIYLGLMGFGVHYYSDCVTNYNRFRDIYIEATEAGASYDGPITADQALYYRNVYRRYRDYSVLAIAAVYLLQVIDANVFAYMHDFEVDDNLALNFSPTVIVPERQLAVGGKVQNPAVGFSLGIRF